jgi:SNF family Na+-dependent transporter
MQDVAALTSTVSALWLTVAILAGGYARTRNRSAWAWFLLTVFLGPIAAFLLVVWPAREPAPAPPGANR